MREKKILKKIKEVVKKPIERRRKRKEKIELFDYLKKIEEEYKIFIKEGMEKKYPLEPTEIILDLTVEKVSSKEAKGEIVIAKGGGFWEKRNTHTIKIRLVPKEK